MPRFLSGILLTLSEYSLPPSHILHSSFYLKSRAYIMKHYYSLKCYWNVKFGPSCENIPIKSAAIGYSNVQETVFLPKDYCFIVTFSLKSSQDTEYFLTSCCYKGRSRYRHRQTTFNF